MKEMNWICDELRKSQTKKNHVAQRGVRSPPLTASNNADRWYDGGISAFA